VPYTSGNGKVEKCPKTCDDGSIIKLYKTKNYKTYRSAADAKLDILTNGPIETGFSVYQDFFSYNSGIYKHVTG
jgi:cathepsin B